MIGLLFIFGGSALIQTIFPQSYKTKKILCREGQKEFDTDGTKYYATVDFSSAEREGETNLLKFIGIGHCNRGRSLIMGFKLEESTVAALSPISGLPMGTVKMDRRSLTEPQST